MPSKRLAAVGQKEEKESFQGYGLIFLLVSCILTLIFWWQLPPQIPLFYSLPYGSAQLANRVWFLLLPGLSVGFYVCYRVLPKLSGSSHIFAELMRWLFSLSQLLLLIAIIHTIVLVL